MDETLVSKARGRRQQQRAKANSFSPSKRRRFLDALALTCNITRAAAFAGTTTSTVQRAKMRDPVFAGQWAEALAIGYDRIETLVLEHGGAGLAIEPDGERALAEGFELEPFDFDRAMKVLIYRRAARDGQAKATGRPRRPATREETNAALMKALAAAKRRIDASRAREPDD